MVEKPFCVVPAGVVNAFLGANLTAVVEIVRQAYLSFDGGDVVNPHSLFLRFGPDNANRIIALPAYLDDLRAAGLKWIASVPGNISQGIPRASAVVILNDPSTGIPVACMEGSAISAIRTAASAALCARALLQESAGSRIGQLGVVGAGVIADTFLRVLGAESWQLDELVIHDLDEDRATSLAERASRQFGQARVSVSAGLEQTIRQSDLVFLATTASAPYLDEVDWFTHRPVVLHISLRDITPKVLFGVQNIVDDRDHVLRENTSLYLASLAGDEGFKIEGTIADLLLGRISRSLTRPTVVSPFGLGMLDIAVAKAVYDHAIAGGLAMPVPGFFSES
jgi:N-[(2S)-2-amino-2-carboxyethyl]-L-glutamate dehydrogenase